MYITIVTQSSSCNTFIIIMMMSVRSRYIYGPIPHTFPVYIVTPSICTHSPPCSDPLDMTGSVCNGVGQCECGECVCDKISQESELVFQGSYCQYNPLNCPIARDDSGQFKPCAGEENTKSILHS